MFLILIKTLEKFNFNINIFNAKKFIRIVMYEVELKNQSDFKQLKEIEDEINKKIKENNEKRLEETREDLER